MLRTIIISSRGDYLQFPSKDAIKAFGLLAQNNEEVLTAPHGVQITQLLPTESSFPLQQKSILYCEIGHSEVRRLPPYRKCDHKAILGFGR